MKINCHLYTLSQTESDDNNDTSSDESDLEVISTVDETDNIAISIKDHFNLDDNEEDNNNEEATDVQQSYLTLNSNNTELNEGIDDLNASVVSADQSLLPAASSAVPNSVGESPSCKRKRRQRSTTEKLHAIGMLEKAGGNKLHTSKIEGCTRYQLSQWEKQKEDLIRLAKENHGRKRKRLPGAGHKLQFPELDKSLLEWFRERRTAPDIQSNVSTVTTSIVVKREKVTFKPLPRRGNQISIEVKHEHPPSTKWYGRFMRRHRLSLQQPKRQQKVPLNEAHLLVNSFHTYIRRASTWGPKRGAMGAFLPRDVVNMDESPLSLFGDQTKLSINDVNTSNEVEGHLSDKRFCTVILTVFGEDNTRVGPVVLFKGKGQVSEKEKIQYASDVKVFFTPKAFNNRLTMDQYIGWWYSKVKDGQPKLFITDSSSTHLNEETIRLMRKQRVVVAVIPKGCTMYIQSLDVHVFSTFKHHHYECAEEWIEKNGGRSNIKLTAAQSRILCTRLVSSAWSRTLKSIDPMASFLELGYVWNDNSLVRPRSLPGYCFDPTDVDYSNNKDPNIAHDQRIDEEARKATEQHNRNLDKNTKQKTLFDMWKKI